MGYDELLVDFKYQKIWEKMKKANIIIVQGSYYKVVKSSNYDITVEKGVSGALYKISPHLRTTLLIRPERGGRPVNMDIPFTDIKVK